MGYHCNNDHDWELAKYARGQFQCKRCWVLSLSRPNKETLDSWQASDTAAKKIIDELK